MTHDQFERLWLKALRENADDTVELLENPRKQERERRTCAAFLRCAGIDFALSQVSSSVTEPPDTLFDSARFEIALVLPPHRKMHDDWKVKAKSVHEAKTINDLMEPYRPIEALTRQQVIDVVIPMADKKAQKYKQVRCASLDLLLYINQGMALKVDSSRPTCEVLLHQGWRSVSILIPPYSYVVLANNTAPHFISELVEKPTASWKSPGLVGLFDV